MRKDKRILEHQVESVHALSLTEEGARKKGKKEWRGGGGWFGSACCCVPKAMGLDRQRSAPAGRLYAALRTKFMSGEEKNGEAGRLPEGGVGASGR